MSGEEETKSSSSSSSSSSMSTSRWRVKMYHLNEDGQWSDKGTGFCSCSFVDAFGEFAICIESEDPDQYNTQYRLSDEDIYQRQGNTIITWKEPTNDIDLALSFQEEEGCKEVWNKINDLQGKVSVDFTSSTTNVGGDDSDDSLYSNQNQSWADGSQTGSVMSDSVILKLPNPTLKNLQDILEIVTEASDPVAKTQLAHAISTQSPEWFEALLGLFETLEDLEDEKHLYVLYKIMLGIAILNETTIFEIMVSKSMVERVMGVFEYDPKIPPNLRKRHRDMLIRGAKFKQVVPVNDEEVLQKIHESYRLEYLKDMILGPRCMFYVGASLYLSISPSHTHIHTLDTHTHTHIGTDENMTIATVNTLLHLNNCTVVMRLQSDETFLVPLLDILAQAPLKKPKDSTKIEDAVSLLHTMYHLANNLQMEDRDTFYHSMRSRGRSGWVIMERLLSLEYLSRNARLKCIQIVSYAVMHKPYSFHEFVCSRASNEEEPKFNDSDNDREEEEEEEEEKRSSSKRKRRSRKDLNMLFKKQRTSSPSLLWLLTQTMVCEQDSSMTAEAKTLLELALNPDAMDMCHKDKFLGIFYDHYIGWLLLPLSFDCEDSKLEPTKHLVCEMVSYFVRCHGFRIKYYILRHQTVENVLKLLRCKTQHVKLSAVRFVKYCLSMKDEFYNRYLVRNDLLRPIFEALKKPLRDNLLNSAIFDIAEFVRSEKINSVVKYLIENLSECFEDIVHVQSFQKLKDYYDETIPPNTTSEISSFSTSSATARQEDEKFQSRLREDAYFDEDDDDDDDDGDDGKEEEEQTNTFKDENVQQQNNHKRSRDEENVDETDDNDNDTQEHKRRRTMAEEDFDSKKISVFSDEHKKTINHDENNSDGSSSIVVGPMPPSE